MDAEYPWQLCVAYADAIIADLRALMIPPLGTAQFDLPHLLYNQIMGAARGLQSEDLVYTNLSWKWKTWCDIWTPEMGRSIWRTLPKSRCSGGLTFRCRRPKKAMEEG